MHLENRLSNTALELSYRMYSKFVLCTGLYKDIIHSANTVCLRPGWIIIGYGILRTCRCVRMFNFQSSHLIPPSNILQTLQLVDKKKAAKIEMACAKSAP